MHKLLYSRLLFLLNLPQPFLQGKIRPQQANKAQKRKGYSIEVKWRMEEEVREAKDNPAITRNTETLHVP